MKDDSGHTAAPTAPLPRPVRCAEHPRFQKGCKGCQAFDRAKRQLRNALIKQGKWEGFVPAGPAREHIETLRAAGMSLHDIGRRSGLRESHISAILWEKRRLSPATAKAVLGVTLIPAHRRGGVVDATATRRMLQALALQNWSCAAIGAATGEYHASLSRIRNGRTRVSPGIAATVADFYAGHIHIPGPSRAVRCADRASFLPARMWSEANIGDPGFDPLAPLAQPCGVRRRLQALARDGRGPALVAARIGEHPQTVAGWMVGTTVPGYALHLVTAAYEELAVADGTIGGDLEARALALRSGWASCLAWEGLDIDDPGVKPELDAKAPPRDEINSDRVYGALHGIVPKDELTTAERRQVVTTLHARGRSDREIGTLLNWSDTPDRSVDAVMAFRRSHHIGVQPRKRDLSMAEAA